MLDVFSPDAACRSNLGWDILQEHGVENIGLVCIVPVRLNGERIEFCLVARGNSSRWHFPQLEAEQFELESPRQAWIEVMGFDGSYVSSKPLGVIAPSRTGEGDAMAAYLAVINAEPLRGLYSRKKWCLAEETRLRIRRKPVRRLVDLALKQVPTLK